MQIFNTILSYGLVSRLLHWSLAIIIFASYILGTISEDMDYYDPMYQIITSNHIGLGIIILFLTLLRIIWNLVNKNPIVVFSSINKSVASIAQKLMLLLVIFACITGYLILSADGNAIDFYGLFSLPPVTIIYSTGLNDGNNLQKVIEEVHEISANMLLILASMHAFISLWHHFILKDGVLKSMLGKNR